jgi:hypothetical protein
MHLRGKQMREDTGPFGRVASKPEPGDYDACCDIGGVEVEVLDSVFVRLREIARLPIHRANTQTMIASRAQRA